MAEQSITVEGVSVPFTDELTVFDMLRDQEDVLTQALIKARAHIPSAVILMEDVREKPQDRGALVEAHELQASLQMSITLHDNTTGAEVNNWDDAGFLTPGHSYEFRHDASMELPGTWVGHWQRHSGDLGNLGQCICIFGNSQKTSVIDAIVDALMDGGWVVSRVDHKRLTEHPDVLNQFASIPQQVSGHGYGLFVYSKADEAVVKQYATSEHALLYGGLEEVAEDLSSLDVSVRAGLSSLTESCEKSPIPAKEVSKLVVSLLNRAAKFAEGTLKQTVERAKR